MVLFISKMYQTIEQERASGVQVVALGFFNTECNKFCVGLKSPVFLGPEEALINFQTERRKMPPPVASSSP